APVEGFTFGGWTVTGVTPDVAGDYNMPDNDVAWTANWTRNIFTITYYLDGGTNYFDNPGTFTIEDLPIQLHDPTKDNWSFIGWYDNEEFDGSPVTIISEVGNYTLYALWTNSQFTVTYYAGNQGFFIDTRDGSVHNYVRYRVSYGNSFPQLEPHYRLYSYDEHIEFDGWDESIPDSSTQVYRNYDFTAQWSTDPTLRIVGHRVDFPRGSTTSPLDNVTITFYLSDGTTDTRIVLPGLQNDVGTNISDPYLFTDIGAISGDGGREGLDATVTFTILRLQSAGLVTVEADIIDHSRDRGTCDHDEETEEHITVISRDWVIMANQPYNISQGGGNMRGMVTVSFTFLLSDGSTVRKTVVYHGVSSGSQPQREFSFHIGCYTVSGNINPFNVTLESDRLTATVSNANVTFYADVLVE
ncbi:MAG: InlB B-repeat-containing protein, partial [Clostridiales bacterium]|nr:InlB B-repeat-containing protein [Clostridiales bacterium]